jgi:hypothetical protein
MAGSKLDKPPFYIIRILSSRGLLGGRLDDGREGVVGAAVSLQLAQLLDGLVQGDGLATVLGRGVVSPPHIDLSALNLLVSDD